MSVKSFNYKVMGLGEVASNSSSLYERVLKTRGLDEERVQELMNTKKADLEEWRHLRYIEKGVDILISSLENDEEIALLVDCDADGYTSSAEFYNYVKKLYPNAKITIIHHAQKTHGLHPSINISDTTGLVVLLDAGTNDYNEMEVLLSRGIKVLCVDHHKPSDGWIDIGVDNKNVAIINNQTSPDYMNKSISGSGVTYKFLQAVDSKLGVSLADNFLDLAGLGCIADIMDSTEIDTRYLMNYPTIFEAVKNPMLKQMIEDKILKYDTLNITSLAWKIIPVINSVCRLGTQEDKAIVFNGFISKDEEEIKEAIKKANSCKSKQDRLKKKAIEQVVNYIEENKLSKYPVIVVDITELYDDGELNGVVCNSLADTYNRPIFIFAGKHELMRGSARNGNEIMFPNLRRWAIDTNLFKMAEGHDGAFGCEIERGNISKIMEYALEELGEPQSNGKTYLVEDCIDFKDLKKADVVAIGKLSNLWATNIKEPLFTIKGVSINSGRMEKKGSRNNVMLFNVDGFSFIKLFLSGAFYDRVTLANERSFGSINLTLDVLCKFKANVYEGTTYPQLEIVDINSSKMEEILF